MRKLWFKLLMLAPACLPASGKAGEVIATTTRQPVAVGTGVAISAPVTAPPRSVPPAADGMAPSVAPPVAAPPQTARAAPVVSLGRPVIFRGSATSPSGLVADPPVSAVQATPAPVARGAYPDAVVATTPAFRTTSPYHPVLMPGSGSVPGSSGMMPRYDGTSQFAVERVSYRTPELPPPQAGTGLPEQLPYRPTWAGASPGGSTPIASTPVLPEPVITSYAGGFDAATLPAEDMGEGRHFTHFYGSAEYLMWWTKRDNVPPLATTSVPGDDGILGNPTTRVLFGGSLDDDTRSGVRFRLGYWFDTPHPFAVEAGYFSLSQKSDNFVANSNQFPLIARPFFNLNTTPPREDSELLASPGLSTGTLTINAPSEFWGAEANLRCHLCCNESCCGGSRLDLLGGYRYLRLREGLSITEQGVNTPPLMPGEEQFFLLNDSFQTKNEFHGGQLGLAWEGNRGRWSLGLRSTVALGVTHETLDINGNTMFVFPDGSVTSQRGALLALPSNIGHYTRDRFAVVPEVGATVGFQLTDWLKLTVGYNFLYWSSVVRPGEQIDRGLNVNQIPGFAGPPPAPGFGNPPVRQGPIATFRDTSYWAQGLTFGLEFRY
jgi:hypothetical protein